MPKPKHPFWRDPPCFTRWPLGAELCSPSTLAPSLIGAVQPVSPPAGGKRLTCMLSLNGGSLSSISIFFWKSMFLLETFSISYSRSEYRQRWPRLIGTVVQGSELHQKLSYAFICFFLIKKQKGEPGETPSPITAATLHLKLLAFVNSP